MTKKDKVDGKPRDGGDGRQCKVAEPHVTASSTSFADNLHGSHPHLLSSFTEISKI